jgi:hypothetical protein
MRAARGTGRRPCPIPVRWLHGHGPELGAVLEAAQRKLTCGEWVTGLRRLSQWRLRRQWRQVPHRPASAFAERSSLRRGSLSARKARVSSNEGRCSRARGSRNRGSLPGSTEAGAWRPRLGTARCVGCSWIQQLVGSRGRCEPVVIGSLRSVHGSTPGEGGPVGFRRFFVGRSQRSLCR